MELIYRITRLLEIRSIASCEVQMKFSENSFAGKLAKNQLLSNLALYIIWCSSNSSFHTLYPVCLLQSIRLLQRKGSKRWLIHV